MAERAAAAWSEAGLAGREDMPPRHSSGGKGRLPGVAPRSVGLAHSFVVRSLGPPFSSPYRLSAGVAGSLCWELDSPFRNAGSTERSRASWKA
jgi:hypothetical protein